LNVSLQATDQDTCSSLLSTPIGTIALAMAAFDATIDGQPGRVELNSEARTIRLSSGAGALAEFDLNTIAFIRQHSTESDGQQTIELVRLGQPAATENEGGSEGWPTISVTKLTLPPSSNLLNQSQIKPLLNTPPSQRKVSIITNAFAGARRAPQAIDRLLKPLLDLAWVDYDVHETESVGDAGTIAARLVKGGAETLILAGGDGTVGEVVNGLLLGDDGQLRKPSRNVGLIVV
jgi:hypothetical protein